MPLYAFLYEKAFDIDATRPPGTEAGNVNGADSRRRILTRTIRHIRTEVDKRKNATVILNAPLQRAASQSANTDDEIVGLLPPMVLPNPPLPAAWPPVGSQMLTGPSNVPPAPFCGLQALGCAPGGAGVLGGSEMGWIEHEGPLPAPPAWSYPSMPQR